MSAKSEGESLRQLKIGALMAYTAIGVNIFTGLIYTPWMVDKIGQSNYGLYTLSTSLISMLVIDFGLSTSVTRFLSKYNASQDQASINNFLGMIYKLFIVIDAFIGICLVSIFFFITDIYKSLSIEELNRFKVIFVISAAYSVLALPFSTFNGILISYEKFILYKTCELFNRFFTMLTMILALSFGYGLYTLVSVNALSGSLTIILKYIIIKSHTPVKINFSFKDRGMLKDILSFSVWSMVVSIAERFIFSIIPTILGAVAGAVSIANFGIAATLEAYVYAFSNAITSMFLPKVSRIVTKEENPGSILPLMIKVGRIQFLILGLICGGFICVGKEFIGLWMGENFTISYYCTILLIIPSLLELPQQIAHVTVVAVNKVKLESYVYIGMALINIFLSTKLSASFGELGAAASICAVFLFRMGVMNVIYYKILKINVFCFFKECYVKIGMAFLATVMIVMAFNNFIIIGGWIGFLVRSLLISFIYIIINWFFTLNQYEKLLFTSAFHKILGRLIKNN